MDHEVAKSMYSPDEWRVEAIDHDREGECYLALFSGPMSKERAEEYAQWKNSHRKE